MCRNGWSFWLCIGLDVGLTDWDFVRGICRDAGMLCPALRNVIASTDPNRIVEYATREQAQQAVNTLSNQNLMGRLVYVREVCPGLGHHFRSPVEGWEMSHSNLIPF